VALQAFGTELVDMELSPDSQPGGLSLGDRLGRIEDAIGRVDVKVDLRLASLEARVALLEAYGSREAQAARREAEKVEDMVTALDRRTWSSDQVQATLSAYRRWLAGALIGVAAVASGVVGLALTKH
jgi:hypothetical protein